MLKYILAERLLTASLNRQEGVPVGEVGDHSTLTKKTTQHNRMNEFDPCPVRAEGLQRDLALMCVRADSGRLSVTVKHACVVLTRRLSSSPAVVVNCRSEGVDRRCEVRSPLYLRDETTYSRQGARPKEPCRQMMTSYQSSRTGAQHGQQRTQGG